MSRKIIQITSSSHPVDGNVVHALCDDGSLWVLHGDVWDPVRTVPQTESPRREFKLPWTLSRRQQLCCWVVLVIATCLGASALDVDDGKIIAALGLAPWQQG